LTCMDMQLRKSSDLRRSSPTLAGSFERTGRTHRLQRTPKVIGQAAARFRYGERASPTQPPAASLRARFASKGTIIQASLASPAAAAKPFRWAFAF
jgi:hypothetical protein